MNDDYLWDKSGEPDPQIQQLEEILGTLRYQPRPLSLPQRQRNYLRPLLAIAATVVIALLAGGLWLQVEKGEASIPAIALENSAPVRIQAPWPESSPELTYATQTPRVKRPSQSEEAVAAKQQLMFALRLASEKLNAAYRRTQGPSQIKNQHRAG
jgi:hypothetical protein